MRLGAILVELYITRLVRGMGVIELVLGMQIVGGTAPLGIETHHSIGLTV